MEQEAVYFGENIIIKSTFHKTKKPINVNEVDIKTISLLDKNLYVKYSFKCIIGQRHEGNGFPSLLYIKRPQMNSYSKYFDKNSKYMNHFVKVEKILKKYLKIWNKIKTLNKKELNSESVYNDKQIKTKTKIYKDKVYTNFQHNKTPKDNEYRACLSVILIDSIFVNSSKQYYPQIFLEER